jgi:hypothetical protein
MCGIDAIPFFPNRSQNRGHKPAIARTVILASDSLDECKIRLVKPVYSLLERPAGEIGNNLKPRGHAADFHDA